ncbi:MAG TPA: DNA polymerase III subunit delta, partial [Vicinamibacterales bacterium]|nr:DNA polymerase III subunit delta [Vicinamibacterales bacterium]
MSTLSQAALRTHIQGRKFAPVYLFFGDDVRLMEQMVESIEASVDPADRPFAVERLHAGTGEGDASPLDVAAAANVFPMLGDRRIVVVLRAERFLKPKRGGKAAEGGEAGADEGPADDGEGSGLDTAPLEDYVSRPAPASVLVFVASGIDRTRRLTKRLLEKATCVEFAGLAADNANERRDAHREAVAILQKEFAANGRAIEPAAIATIVDRAGGDISKLRGDVERLMLYTDGQKTITKDDVEEVVSIESDVDDWAVVNAIGDGDAARALKEAGLRFERGDSPHALVGQLRWWV